MVRLFCGFRFHTSQDIYFNIPINLLGENIVDEKSGAVVLRIPIKMTIKLGDHYTTSMKDLIDHFHVGKRISDEFDFLVRELHENFTYRLGPYELCGAGKTTEPKEYNVVVLVEGKDSRLEKPQAVEDGIEKFRTISEEMDLQGKFGFYCYEQ